MRGAALASLTLPLSENGKGGEREGKEKKRKKLALADTHCFTFHVSLFVQLKVSFPGFSGLELEPSLPSLALASDLSPCRMVDLRLKSVSQLFPLRLLPLGWIAGLRLCI